VSNETGSIEMRVWASDAVLPGVAVAEKGCWPKRWRKRVNVNVLNPGHRGDMGEGTCVHGVEVTVEAARGGGGGLDFREK
jgi:anaerobic selenocysteine-containing dehydrogenase